MDRTLITRRNFEALQCYNVAAMTSENNVWLSSDVMRMIDSYTYLTLHVVVAIGQEALLIDTNTGAILQRFKSDLSSLIVHGRLYDDDKKLLFAAFRKGMVSNDVVTGKIDCEFENNSGNLYDIAVSPKCMIVTAHGDNNIRFWDLTTGRCTMALKYHEAAVYAVAVSADERIVVSGSEDRTVNVHVIGKSARYGCLKGHLDAVYTVAISRLGTMCASGSGDKTIRLWNLKTRTCFRILEGHNSVIARIIMSDDAKKVVSSSHDNTIRMWDTRSGACIRTFSGIDQDLSVSCRAMSLSPSGSELVASHGSMEIAVWDTKTGAFKENLAMAKYYYPFITIKYL